MFGLIVNFIILCVLALGCTGVAVYFVIPLIKREYFDVKILAMSVILLVVSGVAVNSAIHYSKDIFEEEPLVTEIAEVTNKRSVHNKNSNFYYVYIENNVGNEIRLSTSIYNYAEVEEGEKYKITYYKNSKSLESYEIIE